MKIRMLRDLFPVTAERIYLNNAAESPLHLRMKERLEEYYRIASVAPEKKPVGRRKLRLLLAGLFGGAPEEYALVPSTGIGLGLTASGFSWKPGDNVVVPADEHWNNSFPWLALKARGVQVRLIPFGADYRICPERLAGQIDKRTRVVAVAAVRFDSGFRTDLKKIAAAAHAAGALFVVDGIQAAGVVPLNVDEDGIDVLSAAGFKWLLGPPGTGFLYVRKSAQAAIRPVLPGMFAAEGEARNAIRYYPDARRYETGTIAYPLFHAWTAGLELVRELGVPAIHARVLKLTGRIIDGLNGRKVRVVSPVARKSERSAILSCSTGSRRGDKALTALLAKNNIIVSLRDGRCRVSPNFFNTEEEIDRFLEIATGRLPAI